MDDATRDELRDHLLKRRRQLVSEGDLRADPNRKDPSRAPDEDEQPLNEMQQAIASRRNRVRSEELAGIEAALRRLKEEPDEYGRCVDCDEWIPLGRLKLLPWAQRCVACESERSGSPGGHRRRHVRDYVD